MFELTQSMLEGLPKNGPTDPIEHYQRPIVGWLFRERINRVLSLLPALRFRRALEVGFGAGAVQLALAPGVDELHGIDLDADPSAVAALLEERGRRSRLVRGDVRHLPYDDESFELVVSFSVFEHLTDYERALREVTRVLRTGGLFLLGMPSVSGLMEAAFFAIGFRGIADHHVTTPRAVSARFADVGLRVAGRANLDVPFSWPLGVRLYRGWLLEKR